MQQEACLEQMGKYQLLRRLATGGMAEVFLAKATGPMGFEKELVVKRILPHLGEEPRFAEMFFSEAKLAARLCHSNVVQIFDFGEQDGSYFIAMEYVDGLTLRTLSKRAGQQSVIIPYPCSARIISLVCEGLAYAHELIDTKSGHPMGLIHRDVSTDNILVSRMGGVKVVDFGIAKAANLGQQTGGSSLKGKLPYMSPEYVMGRAIDLRSDIYALGVVFYELVTGRKPFKAENDVQLAQAIIHQEPPSIRSQCAEVPESLIHIIDRALAKNLEARYSNCRQMQADLERFLLQCGEPIGAVQIAALVKTLSTETDGDKAINYSPPEEAIAESERVKPSPNLQITKRLRRPVQVELVPTEQSGGRPLEEVDVLQGLPSKGEKLLVDVLDDGNHAEHAHAYEARRDISLPPLPIMKLRMWIPAIVAVVGAGLFVCLIYAIGGRFVFWESVIDSEGVDESSLGEESDLLAMEDGSIRPVEGRPSRAEHPGNFGFVKFDIKPSGTVYLEDKLLGPAPLGAVKIAEGTYKVRIHNPELGKDVKGDVVVKAGMTAYVNVNLLEAESVP
jgi:serine/threonine protein kinase